MLNLFTNRDTYTHRIPITKFTFKWLKGMEKEGPSLKIKKKMEFWGRPGKVAPLLETSFIMQIFEKEPHEKKHSLVKQICLKDLILPKHMPTNHPSFGKILFFPMKVSLIF
jgi:hypothetical protein